jgi:hypothetical protein
MRYNLDLPIIQIDGTEFDPPMRLVTNMFLAITTAMKGDEQLTGEIKLKHYALAQRVHKGGVVEIQAEDIAIIKERAGRLFFTVPYGRMVELLEGGAVVVDEAAAA